jgi:hypothetical protein
VALWGPWASSIKKGVVGSVVQQNSRVLKVQALDNAIVAGKGRMSLTIVVVTIKAA